MRVSAHVSQFGLPYPLGFSRKISEASALARYVDY